MNTNGKSDRNSTGGGGQTVSPLEAQEYPCAGDDCFVTERASEMFNLSCNPNAIDPDGLQKKIRCRRCAMRVAQTRGKALGEPGCGVYPLAQTLKTMASGGGREKYEAEHETRFACAEHCCTADGAAREMFNFYDLANVDPDDVPTAIRCRKHAERYAADRGKALGEPGSGTFLVVRNPMTRTGTLRREALTVYACAHPGCDEEGAGPEMYKCFAAPAARLADVLPLVRCERHALEVASFRNKALGEPGCGITPLAATLRRIQTTRHVSPRERWETSYLQWYLAIRARDERALGVRRRH
jgi:nitrite reductase/ring-hydroxylating ferredoxin subunit